MNKPYKLPLRKSPLFKSISEFEKGKILGNGAFATVIEATHMFTRKVFAIKQINLLKLSPVDHENIYKELEIHSRISSPFIVQLFDFWKEGPIIYLVLELCEGGNLYRHMHNTNLTTIEVKRFFVQVLLGLKYLHSKGIIMRDLKPENVVLDARFNAKICDFGWAANVTDIAYCSIKAGTYAYMSPESLQGILQNEKTDIWSLGVFLYELCYNKEPYQGKNCTEMIRKIKNDGIDFSGKPVLDATVLISALLKVQTRERPEIGQITQTSFFKDALYSIDSSVFNKTDAVCCKTLSSSPLSGHPYFQIPKSVGVSPQPNVHFRFNPPIYKPTLPSLLKSDKSSLTQLYPEKQKKTTLETISSQIKQIHRSNVMFTSKPLYPKYITEKNESKPQSQNVVISSQRTTPHDYNTYSGALKHLSFLYTSNTPQETRVLPPLSISKTSFRFCPPNFPNPILKRQTSESNFNNSSLSKKHHTLTLENTIMTLDTFQGRRARRIDNQSYCSFVNEPVLSRSASQVSHSPNVTVLRHVSSKFLLKSPDRSMDNTPPINSQVNSSRVGFSELKNTSFCFNQNESVENRTVFKPINVSVKNESLLTKRIGNVEQAQDQSGDLNIYSKHKFDTKDKSGFLKNQLKRDFSEENMNIYEKATKILILPKMDTKKSDLKMSFSGNIQISRRHQA